MMNNLTMEFEVSYFEWLVPTFWNSMKKLYFNEIEFSRWDKEFHRFDLTASKLGIYPCKAGSENVLGRNFEMKCRIMYKYRYCVELLFNYSLNLSLAELQMRDRNPMKCQVIILSAFDFFILCSNLVRAVRRVEWISKVSCSLQLKWRQILG